MKNKTRFALILLVSLCILVPVVSARRKTQVDVMTPPDMSDFVQYDYSYELPNGHTKVDVCYKFFWVIDAQNEGYAYQYITGIAKENQQMLHGYGVFYSTNPEKPGTITYKIGNVWQPNDPEDYTDDVYWGGHLKICEGTEYFEGIKGQGILNFETMVFELYLDYNPWE